MEILKQSLKEAKKKPEAQPEPQPEHEETVTAAPARQKSRKAR
jgi:hypothetical protein